MKSEMLNIHDEDDSTEGGPPGWMVWAVILISVTVIMATALIIGVFM